MSSETKTMLLHVPQAQSPSLLSGHSTSDWSFEVKFLVSELTALELEWRFLDALSLDPHADPQHENSYLVRTQYFDTPDLDVLQRQGVHRHQKLRLRSYGDNGPIYLEQKFRQGRRVKKQRSLIPKEDLTKLNSPVPAADWAGAWFQAEMARLELRSTCRMQYRRRAYFGVAETGSVRLTFDRDIRGVQSEGDLWSSHEHVPPLLPGEVICEMKFQNSLPALFKLALEEFQLVPHGCSKYRRSMSQLQSDTRSGAYCA